jgi:signal transduction histidine kinase
MKAISGKLTFGSGRPSGLWLTLLLLLAALVPSVCLLWFMNQAVCNERLAVRQKLAEAYRVNLSLIQGQVEANWRQTAASLDAEADRLSPSALFAKQVRGGLADAVVCFDAAGHVAYPGPAPLPEAPEAAWIEAERMEAGNPAQAAAAFARLAEQTNNNNHAARALLAQARCLIKAGDTNAAVAILTGPLEKDRYQLAADKQGRLVVANAELMALELLKDAASASRRVPLERLKQRLLDYDDLALAAPQRRFLMRELLRLAPDAAVAQMLAAEDLAERYLETAPARPAEPGLQKVSLTNVFQFASERGRVVTLHQVEALNQRLRAAISPALLPKNVTLFFLAPGAAAGLEPALPSLLAGTNMPGWRLALSSPKQESSDVMAEQRIASYLMIGVLVSATVLVLAALALRLVRRQIALTQLRNDLVANVTHELKTPLSSMRLLVDTLLNTQPLHEQTAREYLQLIAQENLRLSRLIDNFLTFSRMERNKYAFGFKDVPAAEIVEGAITAVRERFNVPGCQFRTEVAPHLPSVVADGDAMVTALVNLLDNAYKYSGDEKQITLCASADNGSVCFAVRDNGIGLSPRDTKRVFKRFYQVDQRLSRTGGGCGLGLSIVQFIVTAHHGSVRVESQPGRGSTFSISLPQAPVRPAEEVVEPPPGFGVRQCSGALAEDERMRKRQSTGALQDAGALGSAAGDTKNPTEVTKP